MREEIIGTHLKIAMKINCMGLSLDDCDYTVRFQTFDRKFYDVPKKRIVSRGGLRIAVCKTEWLSPGRLEILLTAQVPDGDAEGGMRTIKFRKETDIMLRL